ncbi:CPBP family glutamic-type intramembrane protease [Natrinema sp. 1APR25-10V2]|uniref:CPBP family glutamic-type intramembrane protease n=1 Tax=Natrinema sp. 1APR25-10V2 TaxID=2951081 RepID=UPI002874DFB4|nr:CPBP family glutamic-type intramembrane protease [Natrinema sp. 1APR25-10V2]MDS0473758.1 CPBP family glutamic-type intramembrane protease [Natrinema sp. 1APR25-10V2]
MPQWATFVGLTGVVLVLLLVLSHLTQSAFSDGDADAGASARHPAATPRDDTAVGDDADRADIAVDLPPRRPDSDASPHADSDRYPTDGADRDRSESARGDDSPDTRAPSSVADPVDGRTGPDRRRDSSWSAASTTTGDRRRPPERGVDPGSLSTGMVLANVAFSQGLFALVLLGAAVYTAIPPSALGVDFSLAYLETGLVLGTVAGIAFYAANELSAAVATRFGFDHEEQLRELLSPDSIRGWLLLLLGVLPIIAGFEELLFRAALIGVPAAGFGISPWLLAVGSSVAFALGHGMQGSVGVVVTGLLGFVLAAVFIVTGSLLVVVVSHYLVNALEFVVHEGLEFDWAETLEG